jgi:hypothetical protein
MKRYAPPPRANSLHGMMNHEFESGFIPTSKGRKSWLHSLFPDTCYPPKPILSLLWADRAKWRKIWLCDPLWNTLPIELYQRIDKEFVETVYECDICKGKDSDPNKTCA